MSNLRIESNGKRMGTKVFIGETQLEHITHIEWKASINGSLVQITVIDPTIIINGKYKEIEREFKNEPV